jgi:hypothetical protein
LMVAVPGANERIFNDLRRCIRLEMLARAKRIGQQETLRDLIRQWIAAHPEQHYTAAIRLSDFAEMQGVSPGPRLPKWATGIPRQAGVPSIRKYRVKRLCPRSGEWSICDG